MCTDGISLTQTPLTRAPSLFGRIWSRCLTRLYWQMQGAGRFEWVLHLDLFVRHRFGGWVLPLARSISILVLWWLADGSFGRLDPDVPSNATPHPWPLVSWEVRIRHWGGEGISWGSWQTQLVSALRPHPLGWAFPTSPGFCRVRFESFVCGNVTNVRNFVAPEFHLLFVEFHIAFLTPFHEVFQLSIVILVRVCLGIAFTIDQNIVVYRQHSRETFDLLVSLEFLWSGGEAKG